jgi:hypothetical protein
MNASATCPPLGDAAAILDRHAARRSTGVPTVSLLVGPVGPGSRTWRRWAAGRSQGVVAAARNLFPRAEWVRSIAERVDLSAAALHCAARRAGRDPGELLGAWLTKTTADRQRFWSTLAPEPDDDLLLAVATQAPGPGPRSAAALSDLGDRVVPLLARLAPSAVWPSILFAAGTADDLLSVAPVTVQWATRVPALSLAVAVPAGVWEQYVAAAPESRVKALLKEGECPVPVIDPTAVKQILVEVGAAPTAAAAIAAHGADADLVAAAVAAARATAAPPATQEEDDGARSAAERFLFTFLESLPETTGRFELNAVLDFAFGRRPAEVDLLCRSPRIAVEVDGYYHFLAADRYRRDRTKDWELQRRGYLVLRFLAADVIPQLESIRDRILEALATTPLGGHP